MNVSIDELVRRIHAAPSQIALTVSGGGGSAIAHLLEVPGGSRTLLMACVPYAEKALIHFLGARPEHFCSSPTSRAMAMVTFQHARELVAADVDVAGVACTAGLVTDRPRAGPHHAFVAYQTLRETRTWSLELTKGARSRPEEEDVVSRLILNAVAEFCGVEGRLELPLLSGEDLMEQRAVAPESWQRLLLGQAECIFEGQANPVTGAILSGAFNPMHQGHRRMLELGREILGLPVALEISVRNVDKPPLDYIEIRRRLGQFPPDQPVWLSRAATFEEKSRLFPCATFLVGTDTLRRIADPKYWGGDESACRASIERIAGRGCKFLVFGREIGSSFVRLSDLDLPELLRAICREVPAEMFRESVSSTALRRAGAW